MVRVFRLTAHDALTVGGLGLILGVGAVLRIHALPLRGIIYWDETKFLLEGVRLETGLRILAGAHSAMPIGKAIGTAKPTHALLIALSYAVFGIHDYSALFMNALASLCSIALVFFIGRMLFDTGVGLVSATVLAVSEYDAIYARSALSESDAMAFFLLGVVLWILACRRATTYRSPYRFLAAAGLLFGLAFSTNYRIVVYAVAVVGFDLIYHFMDARSFRGSLKRGMCWSASFCAVPAAWQFVDLLVRARGVVLFRSEITHRPSTYLQEALYQIHGGKQSMVVFAPLPYAQWFVAYEGWVMALVLAGGIIVALRFHTLPWLALLVPLAVPYLFYIWAPVIVPRNLAEGVPFAALLIGAVVVGAARRAVRPPVFTGVCLVVALLAGTDGIMHSWRLSAERSGFTRAAHFLAAQGAQSVLTTSEIPAYYFRGDGNRCFAERMPDSVAALSADIGAGYRFAVIDHAAWPAARLIERRMSLIARFPATQTDAIGANLIAAENTHVPSGHVTIPYVLVYRLRAMGLPPAKLDPQPACNLNVL